MIKTIAYLAPEIPSLSATFVYNEILALQERGFKIIPISVRYPPVPAKEAEIEKLFNTTIILYDKNNFSAIKDNLIVFYQHPCPYLKTLFLVFRDSFKLGLINFEALKLIYHFWQSSKVVQILKRNDCQHLHIHFANVPTQIGMYASLLSGIPFTFTSHANDLFERGFLLKEKVARAKTAITISEYNRKFIIAKNSEPEKIKVIRCGVDSQRYNFIEKQTINKIPVIGSLGRFVEKKGIDDLILAVSQLNQNGLDFSLEIGGDGPLREYLEKLAAAQGLNSKIKFKGAMAHDTVFPWLSSLDMFVLACKKDSQGDQDGIPVVLMEAMAIGIPVISTAISGIPELVEDGISGFLAQPNNPTSLAEAIKRVLDLPIPVSQMTHVARKRIVSEFDKNVNIDRLLEVFNKSY